MTKSLGLVLLACAVVAAAFLSLVVGTRDLPFATIWQALVAFDPASVDHLVISELRLPRTVIGLLAGAALGVAGAVVQGMTRNPLADPGILGVNSGAALFVVFGIQVFGLTTLTGYVWFGLAGAALAAVVVHLIGSLGRGGATPMKLALAGTAFSAVVGSLTTAVLLTDLTTFEDFRFWQVGSLVGRGMDVAVQGVPFLALGALLAFGAARSLNALALGEDVATSWGLNVRSARILCGVSVVLLCGAATAMAGPIGFLGLVVPHVARLITGPDHRWLLPYSALLAALLLLLADVLGRVLLPSGEVQVGLVTAVIGGPVFVLLARRRKVAEL
ncbi:FecCD family ABC transporter permease [Lentzea sp. JNUCC 0626]|uniref:FecCD family ABC transporter permease n=1 Tax=Lentzea sp. JNUCC 0626 TaxID=3367513 RepID=UPI00374A2330